MKANHEQIIQMIAKIDNIDYRTASVGDIQNLVSEMLHGDDNIKEIIVENENSQASVSSKTFVDSKFIHIFSENYIDWVGIRKAYCKWI